MTDDYEACPIRGEDGSLRDGGMISLFTVVQKTNASERIHWTPVLITMMTYV